MASTDDELELRVAALEVCLVEVFAWIDPEVLADARRGLAANLEDCDPRDKVIRLGALQLIEDGQCRFAPGTGLKTAKALAERV